MVLKKRVKKRLGLSVAPPVSLHKKERSCATCRARKVRCSEERPACQQCRKSARAAGYDPSTTRCFYTDLLDEGKLSEREQGVRCCKGVLASGGTGLGAKVKMEFDADRKLESLSQTHPQPRTTRSSLSQNYFSLPQHPPPVSQQSISYFSTFDRKSCSPQQQEECSEPLSTPSSPASLFSEDYDYEDSISSSRSTTSETPSLLFEPTPPPPPPVALHHQSMRIKTLIYRTNLRKDEAIQTPKGFWEGGPLTREELENWTSLHLATIVPPLPPYFPQYRVA